MLRQLFFESLKGSELVLTGGGWVVKPSPWPGHSGLNIPNAICQPQVREAMAGLMCRIARTSDMNLKLNKIGLTPLQVQYPPDVQLLVQL